jgi:molecular chaperone GrpE
MCEDLEHEPESSAIAGESPKSASGEHDALAGWKARLRSQFESWLETVEEIPEASEEPASEDAPDLYSFYEELAALRAENRKGNRKSAEVFSQFGDSLGHFEGEVKRLREQLARLAPQGGEQALPRPHCLALVEMLDRWHRLRSALERTPKSGVFAFLGPDRAWREAWENFRQGVSILLTHLEKLVEQAGVHPISALGQPFDPTRMVAVGTTPAGSGPANRVAEEMAAGYLWQGEVLRPAEVRITTGA